MTKPEALRLAEAMESLKNEVFDFTPVGTELRRLHGVEKDRDDWKESTILSNQRFKLAEEKLSGLHSLNQELVAALSAIRRYGWDTLSGRADGGLDDREWQRDAVREMSERAFEALAKAKGTE